MSVTTRMTALLTRSNPIRPGVVGTARVDRDIDRLLRRVCPGDIVVLDVLDLDRITADALVDAEIAAVVNASPSVSGRYPNLGPEVLMANGVTLIDETGPEVFKKIRDGAKVRLYNGGVYSGDRRLIRGTSPLICTSLPTAWNRAISRDSTSSSRAESLAAFPRLCQSPFSTAHRRTRLRR